MKKRKTPYEIGKSFGFRIFRDNVQALGPRDGVRQSDNAFATCRRYARDFTVTHTKTKKPLTQKRRELYRGMSDGLAAAFFKFEKKYKKGR